VWITRTEHGGSLWAKAFPRRTRYRESPMDKQCARCGEWKAATEFHKNSRTRDGLHSYCKECNARYGGEYQKTSQGRLAHYRAIKKKADQGYYRYGKGGLAILRQGAVKRGIPFALTAEDLEKWWTCTPDICEYCGSTLGEYIALRDFVLSYEGGAWEILRFKRFFRSPKHAAIRWMTIDRKANFEGYTLCNLAKACCFCNSLKNDFFTEEEMKTIGAHVIRRLKSEWEKEQTEDAGSDVAGAQPGA